MPQPLINFMRSVVPLDPAMPNLLSEKEFTTVFEQVREYGTVKDILEANSERVIYNKQKVKSVDCQVMSVLL